MAGISEFALGLDLVHQLFPSQFAVPHLAPRHLGLSNDRLRLVMADIG